MEPRKQAIIDALRAFVRQRPGLEFANYGDVASYRSESRRIAMDKRHAETLLSAVAKNDGITADMILNASESAFSGRLTIKLHTDCYYSECRRKACEIDYCAGQYFPMEYRKAVAAVCASALWDRARSTMPAPIGYRVESWAMLELRGQRIRHEVRATRAAAETELTALEQEQGEGAGSYGSVCDVYPGAVSAREWLRAYFRREYGRTIAGRYFQ